MASKSFFTVLSFIVVQDPLVFTEGGMGLNLVDNALSVDRNGYGDLKKIKTLIAIHRNSLANIVYCSQKWRPEIRYRSSPLICYQPCPDPDVMRLGFC